MRPLDDNELRLLATYNAERSRGLVHTDDWRDYMAGLQERFDAAPRELVVPRHRLLPRHSGGPTRAW